jgi:hypothetical protein
MAIVAPIKNSTSGQRGRLEVEFQTQKGEGKASIGLNLSSSSGH